MIGDVPQSDNLINFIQLFFQWVESLYKFTARIDFLLAIMANFIKFYLGLLYWIALVSASVQTQVLTIHLSQVTYSTIPSFRVAELPWFACYYSRANRWQPLRGKTRGISVQSHKAELSGTHDRGALEPSEISVFDTTLVRGLSELWIRWGRAVTHSSSNGDLHRNIAQVFSISGEGTWKAGVGKWCLKCLSSTSPCIWHYQNVSS